MAHSKQSNTPCCPAIVISIGLSYSLPHTSHAGIAHHRHLFGGAALISASADWSSRSIARSPNVTMPTARPPSHTDTTQRMLAHHLDGPLDRVRRCQGHQDLTANLADSD